VFAALSHLFSQLNDFANKRDAALIDKLIRSGHRSGLFVAARKQKQQICATSDPKSPQLLSALAIHSRQLIHWST
jgi:hypothetical protein